MRSFLKTIFSNSSYPKVISPPNTALTPTIRKTVRKSLNSTAKIIAKIENEEGLNNIEQIVKEADGIMIARGDLGVQLPTEKIPLAQKAIIRCCRKAGKPVITATQMLDSMILNPRPTRAELTDVSNAVFDGTDAVMLSGETAGGKYPVEAVKTMALITHTTEQSDEYLLRMKQVDSSYIPGQDIGHMVTHSAYKLARNINAKAIIIPTLHGNTARMIGSFRPEQRPQPCCTSPGMRCCGMLRSSPA